MEFDPVSFHTSFMEQFIGAAIKQLRKNADLTQEQLAELIGKSSLQVSKAERKLGAPSIRVLMDIAKGLDISVSQIIELAEELSRNQHIALKDQPPSYILAQQRVLLPFLALAATDQDMIVSIAVRLASISSDAEPAA